MPTGGHWPLVIPLTLPPPLSIPRRFSLNSQVPSQSQANSLSLSPLYTPNKKSALTNHNTHLCATGQFLLFAFCPFGAFFVLLPTRSCVTTTPSLLLSIAASIHLGYPSFPPPLSYQTSWSHCQGGAFGPQALPVRRGRSRSRSRNGSSRCVRNRPRTPLCCSATSHSLRCCPCHRSASDD